MRLISSIAAAAVAAFLISVPASAQSGDEGLGLTRTCPPYCPKPVRPRYGNGGSNPGLPPLPPDGPRPDHPKPNWHHPHYHDYDYDYGWPYGLYPRYYRDPGYGYYYDDEYYDDEYVYSPRKPRYLSCSNARSILRRSGYKVIRTTDCKGKSYGFVAQRNGKQYKIIMSARTGAIISRKRR